MRFKITKEYWLVFLIILGAILLRVFKINTDLLFHRDQGLILSDIYRIWHDGKFSLIGPPSDVDGLVHSPIYYWILTPFLFISKGNPLFPAIFQIVLECLSLIFLYLGLKKIFSQKVAFVTLTVYAISYGFVSYSRWFITVPFILPLANLLIYLISLKEPKKNKPKFIFLTALVIGMIIQINAAVGVFWIPFYFFLYRKNLKFSVWILLLLGVLLPALPLVIFQFRHDFVTLKAILNFVGDKSSGVGFSLWVVFRNLKVFIREINHLVLYPVVVPSTLVFIWGLWALRKNENWKIILGYLFIPILFLSIFQRGAISFFLIASLPMALSVMVNGLYHLPKVIGYPILGMILILNCYHLAKIYEPTNALIPIGNENLITLQDRKNVLDWIYQKAQKEGFSIWIYTIPYFQDYPWEYLLFTYANDKYNYLPEKTKDFSVGELSRSKYFFALYEPDRDKPSVQRAWFNEVYKSFGESLDLYCSHDVCVEWHKI